MLVTTSAMCVEATYSRDTSRSFMLLFSPLSVVSRATSKVRGSVNGNQIDARSACRRQHSRARPRRRGCRARRARAQAIGTQVRTPFHSASRGTAGGDQRRAGSGNNPGTCDVFHHDQIGQIVLVKSRIPADDMAICSEVFRRMDLTMSWPPYSLTSMASACGHNDDAEFSMKTAEALPCAPKRGKAVTRVRERVLHQSARRARWATSITVITGNPTVLVPVFIFRVEFLGSIFASVTQGTVETGGIKRPLQLTGYRSAAGSDGKTSAA